MKRKLLLAAALVMALALLAGSAFASEIAGSWKGKITASLYGFKQSRSANVTFTANGGYNLKLGQDTSVGAYILDGSRITLTSSGGTVIKLNWKLSGNKLTMSGKMDIGGFRNVSASMVVTKIVPKVNAVSCPKVDFGEPSLITVKTNDIAQFVKIELDDGTILAESSAPVKPGVFKLTATLPLVKNKVVVYAGMMGEDGTINWSSPKSATLNTYAIARLANIKKAVPSSKKVAPGETVEINITANDKTTRVKIVGAQTVESSSFEIAGNTHVFRIDYTQDQAKKNQKLKIFPGDTIGFKAKATTIKVTFK